MGDGDRRRISAYVLLADPSYLAESIAAYYPHVDRIVLSYDESSTSWTGTPLPVEQCLAIVGELDIEGKCVAAPGRYARLDHDPLDNDTFQRQAALDAASEDADWVLQLDTDEVMSDPATFFRSLARAERVGASGLDYPARWLYTRSRPRPVPGAGDALLAIRGVVSRAPRCPIGNTAATGSASRCAAPPGRSAAPQFRSLAPR